MKRLSYIDYTKGTGIFLVVLGHATYVNENIITWVFSFHMPLFFIISGMLLALNDVSVISFRDFLYKRLHSMMIPYLFFSICYTLIDFVGVYFKQISMHDLKANLICTGTFAGSGPLWFLSTLFFCEILFFFLLKHLGDDKAVTASVILSVLGFTTWYFFRPAFEIGKDNLSSYFFLCFPFELIRCMICMIFLVIPYKICRMIAHSPKAEKSSLVYGLRSVTDRLLSGSVFTFISGTTLMLCTAFLSQLNANIDIHNLDYGNIALFLLNAFMGSLGLILMCKCLPNHRILTPIRFWGQNSLTIMATHLNFYILYLGGIVAYAVNPYIRHAKEYVFLFNILLVTMAAETVLILLINRFIPWAGGKHTHSTLAS